MIEIRSGDRRGAFEVPFRVYGGCSPYVSPMRSDLERMFDREKNPLSVDGHGRFELFTAHRDGDAVGRIVASIHDASNRRHGTQKAQFGFFDCEDARDTADALLGAAENWARANGADEISGNFNLTAMQMVGVVTSGFENAPFTDMMWSPAHIADHLIRCGYQKSFPMMTFETDLLKTDPLSLVGEKQTAIYSDPAYTWLPINKRTFGARMADARLVLNDGFDENPMFVPVSEREYTFQAGDMMWILDPRLSVVVHHEGRPAGVIVCIPDLNPFLRATGSRLSLTSPYHYLRHRMTRDRAVVIYYSVARHLHGKGLNGAMMSRLIASAKQAGYRSLGGTWIADVNTASLRQMEKVGSNPLHRLHLFGKSLESS